MGNGKKKQLSRHLGLCKPIPATQGTSMGPDVHPTHLFKQVHGDQRGFPGAWPGPTTGVLGGERPPPPFPLVALGHVLSLHEVSVTRGVAETLSLPPLPLGARHLGCPTTTEEGQRPSQAPPS